MNETINHAWSLIDEAHIRQAKAVAENLLRETDHLLPSREPLYTRAFARMYHVAAHATSLKARL